jgi:hypothetical protein
MHNMLGAVQTGCGVLAAVLQLFPTGDLQGKMVAWQLATPG